MKIEVLPTPDTDAASVTLDGRFDAHETSDFRTTYDQLEAEGVVNFSIGLGGVEFVDSTALAELVRGMKRARERGGDMVLTDLSNAVRVILELTKLDTAFTIS